MHLARYPIHWHIIGEGQGQYIGNSSIHDTYSRCVTVHGTNNLRVENNVTFNTVGHCFFLEDAVETGNQFVHNLGIQTKCHPTLPCEPTNLSRSAHGRQNSIRLARTSDHVLIPSDNTVVDVLDHQPGQCLPRQRGRGFRPDRLLVRLAGNIRRARSKARRSARRTSGPDGPRCGSSAAIPPTPTSMVHGA